jgi:hypothetical protein
MIEVTTISYDKNISLTTKELCTLLNINEGVDGVVDRCFWDLGSRTLKIYLTKVEKHTRDEKLPERLCCP